MAVASGPIIPRVVGALSCQEDSYLQRLKTEVVSCVEYQPPAETSKPKSKKSSKTPSETNSTTAKTYLIEFADSVLFPEGGGQPTDHGSITPLSGSPHDTIPIANLQRHGLRCVAFSPKPLDPGTSVQQDVDFKRRWDLMQQHTGQHLLSAIMDTMDLETLGWGMGAAGEMNYVEIPRKPTDEELRSIQNRCNEAIRENMTITVETPGNVKADSLPDDYDKDKGVVRFIKIGDLDYNACCGTHLKQTSHISLILLHHTQPIRGTNCRLFFSCGDRAINLAAESINSLRTIGVSLSSGSSPTEVQGTVQRLQESLTDAKRKEKKLLVEVSKFEGDRIKADLADGKPGWCHRPTDGLDFLNSVVIEIRDALGEKGVAILVSGQEKEVGSIMVIGESSLVEQNAAKVKEIVSSVKGGGKGSKWQGKVTEWKKGEVEALRKAVQG
ncbi:ThrRS/AlaRS common domain-containing protein [Aaosphaeria arxii CBS 175.79]|uniref:ThrRS/AlaRS common domain-containing protein n=1 Tax=Aaosphaeria arxii CBS 175.79 TaxID=1450172 RepID=A0A6A5Y9Q0_9PLEO|nr:ThrRS/AlaRS common domain-containing protein [Aaosphaeria arxii CBS 175.79]KAF2022148.1 ThrRS/AlaRS common domain-containing protein [Aaosphaeria arxii CBS 175.79]